MSAEIQPRFRDFRHCEQRTRGYYLTASKYKWHKWFIFDVAYFTGVIFIKGGAILDSVIAWKEIVPPKEIKEND